MFFMFSELCLSHVFGEKGITSFGFSVAKDQDFLEAKNSTLDVIKTFLEKDTKKIIEYVEDIRVSRKCI